LSPLHTRRSYLSISFLHDILHNSVAIPFSQHFQFLSLPLDLIQWLCIQSSTINPHWYSFFVNILFLWNTIPLHILQLQNAITFWSAVRHFLFARGCHSNSHCTTICHRGQSERSMDKADFGWRTMAKLFSQSSQSFTSNYISSAWNYSENKQNQVNGQG